MEKSLSSVIFKNSISFWNLILHIKKSMALKPLILKSIPIFYGDKIKRRFSKKFVCTLFFLLAYVNTNIIACQYPFLIFFKIFLTQNNFDKILQKIQNLNIKKENVFTDI